MGKRVWMALLLAACGAAHAGGPGSVRKQVESSLLVSGTIDLTADGRVAGYALEHVEKLPSGIKGMIARVVPHWRFEPVELDAGATRARARMSLRLVAKKLDADNFSVEIRGAQFGQDAPGENVAVEGQLRHPRYPRAAMEAGVGGTVYAAVRIGRDGRVVESMVEQVNLRVVTDENRMQRWRDLLAQAVLHASQAWTFVPPTRGDGVDSPYWSARVPVEFIAPGMQPSEPHEWHAYVPGPRFDIPWFEGEDERGADAVAGGGVHPLDGGPRLLTALDPG